MLGTFLVLRVVDSFYGLSTYALNVYTIAILQDDAYRAPLAAQSISYELIQAKPKASVPGVTNLFRFPELQSLIVAASDGNHDLPYQDLNPTGLNANEPYRRLLGQSRTVYRPDDMGAAAGSSPGRTRTRGRPR